MKTTLEISDPLLTEARELARREGLTLRAVVERALHRVLRDASAPAQPFRLRNASFRGEGLQHQAPPWERLRGEIYQDRGG